jgi:hypothetical protein
MKGGSPPSSIFENNPFHRSALCLLTGLYPQGRVADEPSVVGPPHCSYRTGRQKTIWRSIDRATESSHSARTQCPCGERRPSARKMSKLGEYWGWRKSNRTLSQFLQASSRGGSGFGGEQSDVESVPPSFALKWIARPVAASDQGGNLLVLNACLDYFLDGLSDGRRRSQPPLQSSINQSINQSEHGSPPLAGMHSYLVACIAARWPSNTIQFISNHEFINNRQRAQQRLPWVLCIPRQRGLLARPAHKLSFATTFLFVPFVVGYPLQ